MDVTTTSGRTATADTEAWLRCFHRLTPALGGVRVVCLPHAGGSASFYRPLSELLARDVSTFVVQYPGRQDRRSEPCAATIPELADALVEVLARWTDDRLVLFGHSMGATVAFETAVRMQERGLTGPAALVLSGRRSPAHFRAESVHTRDDDGIIAEVTALSGTDPRVLDDPEIRRMVLPMLRSDYRAIETFRGRAGRVVAAPITVLTGAHDERVTADEAAGWAWNTRGGFDLRALPGGHFYLTEQWDAVARVIRERAAAARR